MNLKVLKKLTRKQMILLLYTVTYVAILKLLQQQIDGNYSIRQQKKLEKDIAVILSGLNKKAKIYLENVFSQYYLLSLRNIDAITIDIGDVKKIQGAKHAIHKEALKQAINDLYADLAKNTKYMNDEIKKIIRNNAQELLTGMIEGGESYITIKKQLKEKLLAEGVTSFKDAGGKRWKIDSYVDMVVRTKSRILHNEGTMNRLLEYQEKYSKNGEYLEDYDLIQISNHNAEDWCSLFEDKVYSISGKSEYYPSIETLPNRPYNILHPNCKHLFLSYMPTLRGEGEAVSKKHQNLSMSELNKIDYESRKKK